MRLTLTTMLTRSLGKMDRCCFSLRKMESLEKMDLWLTLENKTSDVLEEM